jgi:antitoxin CptB
MGMVENDILFGRFAKAHLHHLSEEQVGRFEKLIGRGVNALFNWSSGKEAVPPVHDHDVMKMIKNFKNEY